MKTVSSKLFVCVVALAAIAGCPLEVEEGSGDIVEEVRELDSFSSVRVSSGLCAHVADGAGGTALLRGDDNLLDEIATTVDEDGVLHVQPVDRDRILLPTHCIEVRVATEQLVAAHAAGGAEIVAEQVVADDVALHASGGAQLFVGQVLADNVDVELSGGANALASGLANELHVEASGGSVARLSLLEVSAVMLEASGGSVVEVSAEDAVLGDASGGSHVTVSGDVLLVQVDTSGGSSVEH
jgi:hypothetical protein